MMRLILVLTLLIFSAITSAHQLSTAYLHLNLSQQGLLVGNLQVRLYDLEQAIKVDVDGDGKLRWRELQDRADVVQTYLTSHVRLVRGVDACNFILGSEWKIDSHFNEAYLLVPMRAQCALTGKITVNYNAFFDEDPEHKLLLNFRFDDNTTYSGVISVNEPQAVLAAEAGSRWSTFREFVYQGIIHIWIGLDHILFLLSLLLTCVLTHANRVWLPEMNVRRILVNTTWIVTAFTLAHSITLTLTALGLINLPSRWVEVGIAVSVALVALNNIVPLVYRLGWLTFGFGLLHGMGFAGVLGELGLPSDQKLLTILGFNLGVELGQLAIVMLILPILIVIRTTHWYARYFLVGASVAIVLMAVQWIIERL